MLVDFHNHFDLFPSWVNALTDTFIKNQNSLEFLLNYLEEHDKKMIIGYALYSIPWFKNEYKEVMRQLDLLDEYEKSSKAKIKVIKSIEDLHSNYRIGIISHLESARWFHSDLSILDKLHARGVYGLIPVHYKNNWFGGSCDDLSAKLTLNTYQKGLTGAGKHLLDKMSELGMWLDISHMNQRTLEDSLTHFDGAVVASHIGLQSIINVDRNLSDRGLELLKKKNGLIGICAWSRITGKSHENLKQMIETLLKAGMEDQIMVGSDFGPPIHTATGNKSIFDFYSILDSLINDEKIYQKITSTNAMNFFERVLPS